MLLSGIASMFLIFPSKPMGQNTTSAIAWTSTIFASMSRSATSQPPQPAPQYCAILIFSAMLVHLSLLRLSLLRGCHVLRRLALHACLFDQPPSLESDHVLNDLRLRDARGIVQLVHGPRSGLHLLEQEVPLQLHARSLLYDDIVPRLGDGLAENVSRGDQSALLSEEPPDPLALDCPQCRPYPGLPERHPHSPPLKGETPSSLIVFVNSTMVFWNFSPSPAETHSSLSLSGSYPTCWMSIFRRAILLRVL